MGMTAASSLKKGRRDTRNTLAIEAMAAAQAIDFLAPLKSSSPCSMRMRRSGRVRDHGQGPRHVPDFAGIAEVRDG